MGTRLQSLGVVCIADNKAARAPPVSFFHKPRGESQFDQFDSSIPLEALQSKAYQQQQKTPSNEAVAPPATQVNSLHLSKTPLDVYTLDQECE